MSRVLNTALDQQLVQKIKHETYPFSTHGKGDKFFSKALADHLVDSTRHQYDLESRLEEQMLKSRAR